MTPGNNSTGGYGETATTSVEHTGGGGYDCVTWNAIVFRTAIADVDQDGLPDALESAATPLKDPNNQTLPHLSAMGATTTQQDMFVEINGMKTSGPTTYGSWDPAVCNAVEALTNKFCAPFNAGAGPVPLVTSVPAPAHNHIPSAAVLNEVAEIFDAHGIKVHFDVGPDLGALYALTTSVPNRFIVGRRMLAAARPSKKQRVMRISQACQFPAFPGTVGWMRGFKYYARSPVGPNGEELTPAQQVAQAEACLRRAPLRTAASDSMACAATSFITCCTHTRVPSRSPFPVWIQMATPSHSTMRVTVSRTRIPPSTRSTTTCLRARQASLICRAVAC